MRQTSELYKQLRTQTGSYYEVKIVRGDVTYGMDKLKSITTEPAMFDGNGPQIGGVYSSQCKVKLTEQSSNWPRAASFEVLIRITDGVQTDDNWLSMGTYYTDERHADKYGNLEIVAFDDMLTLEQLWTDKVQDLPSEWPVTAKKACDMISEALGVQYDSRTVLDNTVPFIGLDTTSTARETLSAVAAGMGGNWHITPDRKLRLIPLVTPPDDVRAIAGIAIAGVTKVGDKTIDEEDIRKYINLGMKVKSIKTGASISEVLGVELTTSSGTIARAGFQNGYVLKGKCDFSDSAAAELCLSKVEGYVYKPFEAASARLDPAAELGDLVEIDGDRYQLCSIHWRIGPHITADISAPYEETIDHEYQILSPSAKTYRKALNVSKQYTDNKARDYLTAVETYSAIEQTESSIRESVAATYVENEALAEELRNYSPTAQIEQNYYNKTEVNNQTDALASEIELTDNRLTVAFSELYADTNDAINAISYYIRYENGVVIVGKTDSPTSIRISNDQIGLYYGDAVVSFWNQNQQYTPKALQIPTGGKFQLGKVLFQPRTSGNLSLMWAPPKETSQG